MDAERSERSAETSVPGFEGAALVLAALALLLAGRRKR
jgi:MYXO-CTERM domain-containing protein